MDKQEAKRILDEELDKYRPEGYSSLMRLLTDQDNFIVKGPDGTEYQVEVFAVWDIREGGDLRVLGAIDDGGFLSSFSPVTSDLLIRPDNTFAGE